MPGYRCQPPLWPPPAGFYEHAARLTKRQWAWELLRRNPAFAEDWQGSSFAEVTGSSTSPVPGAQLLRWGCSFADRPAADAVSARVIWDPLQFPHLTRLVALDAGSVPGAAVFRVSDLANGQLTIRHAGMQIVLLTQSELALQLNVHGADLSAPVHLLIDVVSALPTPSERLLVLAAINDLYASGRFRSGRLPAEPRGARLRMILQALDGSLAGASHREIAIEIFGPDRVADGWRDPRSHLRDSVRRAVSRGRMLMMGGYRQFVSSG